MFQVFEQVTYNMVTDCNRGNTTYLTFLTENVAIIYKHIEYVYMYLFYPTIRAALNLVV